MKLLALHVDYIKFKPLKKALKNVAELSEPEKELKDVKEALVILTAVEKEDSDIEKTIEEYTKNIVDIANQVKTKNIVLYPYAHLSSNLSNPEIAQKILIKSEEVLKKNKFKVIKAPFGYYKEFELKVKGHPLSELSREISIKSNKKFIEKSDSKQLLREISKSKLDTSKLKENDHRIIGKKMDLFSFSEVAPGMVFWHNNGIIIKNELINFIRKLLKEFGYQEILTPQIVEGKLFKISGHWEHYKENMFLTEYEKREFLVKPMNCPGSMIIYRNSNRSYRELPLRFAEFGIVHRKELSGVLAGLFRVIQFMQDDAHIFCTKEQIEQEIENLLKIIKIIYKDYFNFEYSLTLSTKPESFMGEKKDWDYAEKSLENALKKSKIDFKINKGEGAFYGPKIDIHIKDSLGRNWQCGTIQLDMQMPQRFELKYIDKDNKEKTPIVIHRAIFGSLERFIGILLEHLNGKLPTWLAPIQVRIINFTNRNEEYSKQIMKQLKDEIPDLRIDFDFTATTVSSKIKGAEIMKIPWIIVLGDKEEKEKTLAVRNNGKVNKENVKDFINKLKKLIEEKK